MTLVAFIFFAILFCIALYGWGLLLHKLAKYPASNWALTIVIGLAAIIFLGGLLNLLRLAFGWAFDALLVIGVVLAFKYSEYRPKLPADKSQWFYLLMTALLITAILSFTIITQLPPKAFNYHDDFEKYFSHPVRMLQTHTLFGSPLSSVGFETLGGQAVLHAIIMNHFPIPYINGADAVLGLFLCLLLSVALIPSSAVFLPISIVSLLSVYFINPQSVNISALYIAAALMMASILLSSHSRQDQHGQLPSPFLLGLIYAALIAAKSTFVLFPFLQLVFLTIAFGLLRINFSRLIRWILSTLVMTLLFILPWLLLHLPHYLRTSFLQNPPGASGTIDEFPNLLSAAPGYYGSSFADYTFICIAIALAVIAFAVWGYRQKDTSKRIALAGLAANGIVIIAAYLLNIVLAPAINGLEAGLRYSIPFLIAGAPIIFALEYPFSFAGKSAGFKLAVTATALLIGIFILANFSKAFADRVRQAYQSGSILAFSLASDPVYLEYNHDVLYGSVRQRIAEAQAQIPPGKPVIVRISTSFLLDYKRNIIYDSEPTGIANPWAYMPDADYFLVEYAGYAVRSLDVFRLNTTYPAFHERLIAAKSIAFMESLARIANNADPLYNDGRILVLRKHKI